jgi:hypothetical protein
MESCLLGGVDGAGLNYLDHRSRAGRVADEAPRREVKEIQT